MSVLMANVFSDVIDVIVKFINVQGLFTVKEEMYQNWVP